MGIRAVVSFDRVGEVGQLRKVEGEATVVLDERGRLWWRQIARGRGGGCVRRR